MSHNLTSKRYAQELMNFSPKSLLNTFLGEQLRQSGDNMRQHLFLVEELGIL
jgi:hypothetical protein